MTSLVAAAYETVSDGYTCDRVVTDPSLNEKFVAECRRRGSTSSPSRLNRALLNLRKRALLPRTQSLRRTTFRNQDEYMFASEMAVRYLERRDDVSLDDIICDPKLASEFDRIAADIAPGHSPLEYRWAALRLRKSARLRPEILARIAPPTRVMSFRVDEIEAGNLPTDQGLYLFYASTELLYVGEAANLRTRLKKHLDHSDNKGLARWIWGSGTCELRVEIQVLDEKTPPKARKALELELIRSRKPLFNVKR